MNQNLESWLAHREIVGFFSSFQINVKAFLQVQWKAYLFVFISRHLKKKKKEPKKCGPHCLRLSRRFVIFFFNNLDLGKTAVVQYITDTTI